MLKEATRIAVLVSGGGTNLQALIDAEKAGKLKSGKIQLVVGSNPGAYGLKRAEAAGIPSCWVDSKDQDFEGKLLALLRKHRIQMVILAGFMCILSREFVREYADRIINIHPSLIPSFCGKGMYGLKVHEAALSYGVKVTGATVHLVNEIPDGGRILIQRAVEIQEGDTPEVLQKRVMEQAEWKILPEAAEAVALEIGKEDGNL